AAPGDPSPDADDGIERRELIEEAVVVKEILLRFLAEEQRDERERGLARREWSTWPVVMPRGDGDEPELEHVREDQEHEPLTAPFEDRVADHAERKERDGDGPLQPDPAQRHHEEDEHVGEVADLVEPLVVLDAAYRVHEEEVAEVADDRDERAGERPPQRRQRGRDAIRDEDRDLPGHRIPSTG